ncbi:MAG: helix-turn-helix transcriptional regulator [Lachnospiraceae bacterium]|nr:helix-turn-helix transcriptional regulator [Lachnospiraceae bacterium]
MTTLNEFVEEQLKDPKFKEEYDALEPEFAVMQALIDARKESGMTQKELSVATGISQADISRLEHGTGNPSIKTLQRIAKAFHMALKIEFVPIKISGTR